MKKNKFLIILLILSFVISCESDDEIDSSSQLVGEWMRSDFSENFEFKLIFESDNTGLRIHKEGTMETEIISSLVQFKWNVEENTLTFDESGVKTTTKYSINTEGNLMLYSYSDLPFMRITKD